MTTRAETLEKALDDAIAFLRAWSPHPATTAKIRSLEDAKRKAPPAYPQRRALVSIPSYTPAGVPLVQAELVDESLYLRSDLDLTDAWSVYKRLVSKNGLRIPMRELSADEPHTTLEQTLRQQAEGFSLHRVVPSREAELDEMAVLERQLAKQMNEVRHAFDKCTRLVLALAALEGDAEVDARFFAEMVDCLEEAARRISERDHDEGVQDTLAWLNGELDQVLGVPSKRWHLERLARNPVDGVDPFESA